MHRSTVGVFRGCSFQWSENFSELLESRTDILWEGFLLSSQNMTRKMPHSAVSVEKSVLPMCLFVESELEQFREIRVEN